MLFSLLLITLIASFTSGAIWAGDGRLGLYAVDAVNDDYRTVDDGTGPSTPFPSETTIEFWLNDDVSGSSGVTVLRFTDTASSAQFPIFFDDSGPLVLRWNDLDFTSNNDVAFETPGAAFHLALTLRRITDNSTDVGVYVNGALLETGTWGRWPNAINEATADWQLSVYREGASGYAADDATVDEVRIWNVIRTAEEIESWFDRVILEPSDHPELELYLNFDGGDDAALTPLGTNTRGWSDLSVSGSAGAFSGRQLQVTPGYGLDTYTGVTVEGDEGAEFEFPLLGGSSDGSPVVFVIDVAPPELSFPPGTISGSSASVTVTEMYTGDAPKTVVVEYHAEMGNEASLRTRAYLEILPGGGGSNSSSIPWDLVAAGGGGLLVIGLLVTGVMSRGGGKGSGSSRKKAKNANKRLLKGGGGKKRKEDETVEDAIESLLKSFTVTQLNVHVGNLLYRKNGEAALALALRVEQAAVGGAAGDYALAVTNLGSALAMTGHTEALGAVKHARRQTMKMKGRVNQSQLHGKEITRIRKEVARTASQKPRRRQVKKAKKKVTPAKKPAAKQVEADHGDESDNDDTWDTVTVAASVKTPLGIPIGKWMKDEPDYDDMVTLNSEHAPTF